MNFFSRKSFLISALLSLLGLLAPDAACGQTTYIIPQTVTSAPFNNVTCTGTDQFAVVQNLGQASHSISASNISASAIFVTFKLQGSYDGVKFLDISDTGTASSNGVKADGSFPIVRVDLVCTSGATVTIQYSGAGQTPGKEYGGYQLGELDKFLQMGAASGSNGGGPIVQTPFANGAGQLVFTYLGAAGPAGSTLLVKCQSQGAITPITVVVYAVSLTTQAVSQYFIIPSTPACPFASVVYTSGGASAATYNLEYVFAQPGTQIPSGFYSHITTTTATVVKASAGVLHAVSINTGGAGTVSILDIVGSSCTGTPAGNTVAVITSIATTLQTFIYDVLFGSGLCVKASVAMDITVSSQ
jgi:hypothetical protein